MFYPCKNSSFRYSFILMKFRVKSYKTYVHLLTFIIIIINDFYFL